jgi:hypothetical protein
MKIGLDLDGTVYGYPEFFKEFIPAMVARGHQFFCTSAHGRDVWDLDCERLRAIGIDPDMISPDIMFPTSHTDLAKKGGQAEQMDVVFEDDPRVQRFTKTPVFAMPEVGKRSYAFLRW